MTRDQAKLAADARTPTEQAHVDTDDAPDVIVTSYRVTVRIDMTAAVTMALDGPDGEVTIKAEVDARDERGRLTRHVCIDGPRVSTTLFESDLPDWEPQNPDAHRCDRALRASVNVQYIHNASEWYVLYQQKVSGNPDVGAPEVSAAE